MPILGDNVKDPNYVLRFAIIVFMGVLSLGSVIFWREQLLLAADYQDPPVTHEQLKIKKENNIIKNNLRKKLIQTEE